MAFDEIFQPLKFRNLTIKNRILRSNVSGRFDNYDGSGNQARINWETKFAKGGVGAIVSSFVPVHLRGRIVPNYAMIDDDRHIPFWREVGEVGARARLPSSSCSSATAVVSAMCQASSTRPALSSTVKSDPTHGFRCESATKAQIAEVVNAFAEGARRAREAGLDGVELHGANGYLITQFLSSAINDRKDEYGGSLENRARFVLEIVRAIRARVGNDFHLQMKISVHEHNDAIAFFGMGSSGNTWEESVQVCQWLEQGGSRRDSRLGRKLLSPSPQSGRGRSARRGVGQDVRRDDFRLATSPSETICSSEVFRGYARRQWVDAGSAAAEHRGRQSSRRAARQGRRGDPGDLHWRFSDRFGHCSAIRRGDCDAVSAARPLIANNDLVEMFRRGQDRPDRPCTYCNKCLVNVVENPLGCYEPSRFAVTRGDDRADHVRLQPTMPSSRRRPCMSDDLITRISKRLKGRAVVREASPVCHGRTGRDPKRACARRTCTTPKSRRCVRQDPSAADPAVRGWPLPSTAAPTISATRRWEPSDAGSVATCRCRTCLPRFGESADSQSARGEPRAHDAPRVPAGRRS